MPSLIGSGIDANYRKQIVPFSRFGSRKIVWFRVGHLDTNNGSFDRELFNAVVDTIQTKGEIVTVGAPYVNNNYGKFVVGLFEDTFNNGSNTNLDENNPGSGDNNMSETLQAAIQDVLNSGNFPESDYDVNVEQIYMYGAPWGETYDNSGWTANSNYAEPSTKYEFNDGPYGE